MAVTYNPFTGNFDFVGVTTNVNNITITPSTNNQPIKENFSSSLTGSALSFLLWSINGGNLGASNPSNGLNLDGITTESRSGVGFAIISTLPNTQAHLYSIVSSYQLLMSNTIVFYTDWEIQMFGGVIDFANDPCLLVAGYSNLINSFTIANGFYIRPPRLGETNFLKYVVVVASVETIVDSIIPYNTLGDGLGWFKVGYKWDGPNQTLNFYIHNGTISTSYSITSFFTSFPSFLNLGMSKILHISRNGTGTSPQTRAIFYDCHSEDIKFNYENFPI